MTENKYDKAKRLRDTGKITPVKSDEIYRSFIIQGDSGQRTVEFRMTCTCPHFMSGQVCSHMIAAMLEMSER